MPSYPDSVRPARVKDEREDVKGNRQVVSAADYNVHDEEIRAIESLVGTRKLPLTQGGSVPDDPCSLVGSLAMMANAFPKLRDDLVETSSGVVAVKDASVAGVDGKMPLPASWSTVLVTDMPGTSDKMDKVEVLSASGLPEEGFVTIINDISPAMTELSYGTTLKVVSPSKAYGRPGVAFDYEVLTSVPATVSVTGNPSWLTLTGNVLSGTPPTSGQTATTLVSGAASLVHARFSHSSTLLSDGKILVAGGRNDSSAVATCELYDPVAGTWSSVGDMNVPRYSHTATLLVSGKVLVAGGFGASGTALDTAELYDPTAKTWSTTGGLSTARGWHAAILLANGKVLASGGLGSLGSGTATCELYDSGTWGAAGSLSTARVRHAVALLPSGKVLAMGGSPDGTGTAPLATAEAYDPTGNTWAAAASMSAVRYAHTATSLSNGKVLATGGGGAVPAEVYDETGNTWEATGGPSNGWSITATLIPGPTLSGSDVLVTGNSATLETYVTASNSWSKTGSMLLSSREKDYAATRMPDGRVLVTGGFSDAGKALASVEICKAGTKEATGTLTYPMTLVATNESGSVSFALTAYVFQDATAITVSSFSSDSWGYYLVQEATEGEPYSRQMDWTPRDLPVKSWALTLDDIGVVSGVSMLGGTVMGTPKCEAYDAYVADTNNFTVRQVTPGGTASTVAGTAGTAGSVDGTGIAAKFNVLDGIAADGLGNLYIADTNNHTIRKITPTGVVTTLAGLAGNSGTADGTGSVARFNGPRGVVADSSGTLYVSDTVNHTIRKVTALGVVTTIAGTAGISGDTDDTGAAARFNTPCGMALDSAGANLYVADSIRHVIRQITLPGAVVTTPLGTAGTSGSTDGTGASALFNAPFGLGMDGSDNLYVADSGNHVIREVVISTLASSTPAGTAGASGSADGTGAVARFNGPCGIASDLAGNLYVADIGNNTIRAVTPTGVVTTLAGKAGSTGTTDGTKAAARFDGPTGIAVGARTSVKATISVTDIFDQGASQHFWLTINKHGGA